MNWRERRDAERDQKSGAGRKLRRMCDRKERGNEIIIYMVQQSGTRFHFFA